MIAGRLKQWMAKDIIRKSCNDRHREYSWLNDPHDPLFAVVSTQLSSEINTNFTFQILWVNVKQIKGKLPMGVSITYETISDCDLEYNIVYIHQTIKTKDKHSHIS